MSILRSCSLAIVALSAFAIPAAAQCVNWTSSAAIGGTDDDVYALATFDDGTGPALYAGGRFLQSGGTSTPYIAKWNGTSWSALPGSPDYPVYALAVFDDGSGPALYAGGAFAKADGVTVSHIAKWDGSSWSALGAGVDGVVYALTVFDDGSGKALYAGGNFLLASGMAANRIAKWNGTSWSALGQGFERDVYALAGYDDGSGPALYAGGDFKTANGAPALYIARWKSGTWSDVGGGMAVSSLNIVRSLAVYDGGFGPQLCAGGRFTFAGPTSARNIARWNGTVWAALGQGVGPGVTDIVSALTVYDDGSGARLFAGGNFITAGGVPVHDVAAWDGTSWSALASGVNDRPVYALAVHDDGTGAALAVGGNFTVAGGTAAAHVASFDASGWSALGASGDPLSNYVRTLRVLDDGSGPKLYVGGAFQAAGSTQLGLVGTWNGTGFTPLGSGLGGSGQPFVRALAAYGPAIYAGGHFSTAGGNQVVGIARWSGGSWSSVDGSGILDVDALEVFDEGSGPMLFAGGRSATGFQALRIARWNGTSWSAPLPELGGAHSWISNMIVHDDGSGPALFVSGNFTGAGGMNVEDIAKWNGSTWAPLQAAPQDVFNGIDALAVFDDGSGPALYASGSHPDAFGGLTRNIGRWQSGVWSSVGTGLDGYVSALTVHDDGSGPALYATGTFTEAGGVPANNIARWDGTTWSALSSGLDEPGLALAAFDDGVDADVDLFVGGRFAIAGGLSAPYFAKLDGCTTQAFCFGDGTGSACRCGNVGAPGHGCRNNPFPSGALLSVHGTASVSADSLVLSGTRMPNASALYFQGTAQVNGGAGALFGDGLRCVGGSVVRLATKVNASNGSVYPSVGNQPISIRGAIPSAGGVRMYQVWYRNSLGPCGLGSNLTNAMRVAWQP